MKSIIGYQTEIVDGGVKLSRSFSDADEAMVVKDWDSAVTWLIQSLNGSHDVFTVCYSLTQFTKVLFTLLPDDVREKIEKQTDRVMYRGCKIFYVNGRYLGLTLTVPENEQANLYRRAEINIQALKWWISEEADVPSNAQEVRHLGERILSALDDMGFYPTRLTSPIAVFTDNYLGDAEKYPTIFSFNEDWFGAMEYASEMMRFEWRSAYQVGYFDTTHSYDLISAYPSAIAQLPSTDDCRCEQSTEYPSWAQWGIMRGEVEVWPEISPLVYDMGDGVRINPKGKWTGYFTTGEIRWLEKWDAGRFKLDDGWFFRFGKMRPYRSAMEWLHIWKSKTDNLTSGIAKKMSQGMSGKLDEDKQDSDYGDYYNPILAAMTRSHCRLKDADFIYENKLQQDLIAVLVDNVLATRQVDLGQDIPTAMGRWRYEGEAPALVLGKGGIWRQGKRPQGISYDELIDALRAKPDMAYYELNTVGGSVRSIDLLLNNANVDRVYDKGFGCGGEIMSGVAKSRAVEI